MNDNKPLALHNLAAILVSVAVVLAPHVGRVPGWIVAFCSTALLLRFYLGWQQRKLPAGWLLILAAAIAVAGVLFSYRTLFGRDSGVALLLVMVSLKLLEMQRSRDVFIVVLLSYFLTITNFFYSQTIVTAIYSIAAIWVITATMVSLQHAAGAPRFGAVVRSSGTLLMQSVPLMLVLFILFPRVQGPLWGLPQTQISARSGLSDTMSPGSITDLSLSDEIAFRVQFDTPPENPAGFYWRGPVMWTYDGRSWRTEQPVTMSMMSYEPLAPPIRYTVTLEPHEERWLFMIDLPSQLPPGSVLTRDYQVLSVRPVRERRRYDGESMPAYRIGSETVPAELQRALQLPPNAARRARALAEGWRQETADDRAIVERALQMFRDQPFIYTLAPPELTGDPVDEFLFETRSGFCEHYASSFAVLMRAAGIPTRIVTGYLGGEMNPVDNYLVVRQAEAHAWTEIWLADDGWVRVDPTAAVSPFRISLGVSRAVPTTDPLPLLRRTGANWLRTTRHAWDAVTNSWNQWVLGYSQDRQSQFFASIGLPNVTWRDMVIVLFFATGAILLVFAFGMLRKLARRTSDPVQRAWQRFCDAMAARGAPRKSWEGPRDFTARIAAQFPETRERIEHIGMLYIRLRYGGPQDPQALAQLREAVDAVS
jgi:protein-glutamine gamma-glutamyltransferase